MSSATRILIALILGAGPPMAIGQPALEQRQQVVKEDSPPTGSLLRRDIARSTAIPLNKRYGELSPSEKANLKSQYQSMPEEDEPPFPADGMAPIVKELAELASAAQIKGEVRIHVNIDASGKATSVDLVKYPSLEAAKSVAYVLVQAKYKPGVCGGKPCSMGFPFSMVFKLE